MNHCAVTSLLTNRFLMTFLVSYWHSSDSCLLPPSCHEPDVNFARVCALFSAHDCKNFSNYLRIWTGRCFIKKEIMTLPYLSGLTAACSKSCNSFAVMSWRSVRISNVSAFLFGSYCGVSYWHSFDLCLPSRQAVRNSSGNLPYPLQWGRRDANLHQRGGLGGSKQPLVQKAS